MRRGEVGDRAGLSMGGRRGGEQRSSQVVWRGAWRPAKAALEAAGVLARRVEAVRRLGSQIRGGQAHRKGRNRGGEWRRLGEREIGARH